MPHAAEKLLCGVEWHPHQASLNSNQGTYDVTHQGILKVNTFEIRCYRASDGMSALDMEDIERFFRGCPHCANPSECQRCSPARVESKQSQQAIYL